MTDVTLARNDGNMLNLVTRAANGRYRYVALCAARKEPVDVQVDNQLLNHLLLIEEIAKLAGKADDEIMKARNEGIAQARAAVRG